MIKTYCDICGKEITNFNEASEYKLKKRVYLFHEGWWENLIVHNECWNKLNTFLEVQRR